MDYKIDIEGFGTSLKVTDPFKGKTVFMAGGDAFEKHNKFKTALAGMKKYAPLCFVGGGLTGKSDYFLRAVELAREAGAEVVVNCEGTQASVASMMPLMPYVHNEFKRDLRLNDVTMDDITYHDGFKKDYIEPNSTKAGYNPLAIAKRHKKNKLARKSRRQNR